MAQTEFGHYRPGAEGASVMEAPAQDGTQGRRAVNRGTGRARDPGR